MYNQSTTVGCSRNLALSLPSTLPSHKTRNSARGTHWNHTSERNVSEASFGIDVAALRDGAETKPATPRRSIDLLCKRVINLTGRCDALALPMSDNPASRTRLWLASGWGCRDRRLFNDVLIRPTFRSRHSLHPPAAAQPNPALPKLQGVSADRAT